MPEPISSTMAMFFINSIPYICFLYGISLLMFSDILSEGQNKFGLYPFLITLGYIFLPVRTCLGCLTNYNVFKKDETHDSLRHTFLTDYDRINPITKKEAELENLERLKEKNVLTEEQYIMQMNMQRNMTTLDAIQYYSYQNSNLQTRVMNTYQPTSNPSTIYVQYNPYPNYLQYYYPNYGQPGYGGGYYYGNYGYSATYANDQNQNQQNELQRQTSQVTPVNFYSTQPVYQQPPNNQYYPQYQS